MKIPRQTPRRQEEIQTHTHTHLSVVFGITSVRSCGLSPTLIRPMDCGPSGSSVRGISQARILEWVAISFYGRHLPDPGIEPQSPGWGYLAI